jgi:hypothetical protein
LYAKKKNTISKNLFGYHLAKLSGDLCYLIEGCFDAMAVTRLIGDSNSFATGGSILHPAQAKLLEPFETIVIIPDMTGKAESLIPSTKRLLPRKKLLTVVPPIGLDIDDWGRKDSESAKQSLLNPSSVWESQVKLNVDYSVSV